MKLNKLLFVSVAMLLGLSACQKGPNKDSGHSYDGSDESSESEPIPGPEPEKSLFYFDEGISDGFPIAAIDEFLEYYEANFDVIPLESDQDWGYQVGLTQYCSPVISVYTDDSNPNSDNKYIEDLYKELLEEEEIEVDDSDYASSGYVVWGEDDEFMYNFYTEDDLFILFIYGSAFMSEEIYQDILDYFFYNAFLLEDIEIPLPESENTWDYYTYFEGSDSCLKMGCEEENTPNNENPEPTGNSMEDVYKAQLEDEGWTIDDSNYELTGYWAYSNELPFEIQFFSWNEYFYFNIFCNKEFFPTESLENFLVLIGADSDVVVPIPESEGDWNWGFDEDEYGPYFYAITDDEGTPGEDAIEDQYKAVLNGDDWDIDDSEYEEEGYYAVLENVMIQFYSYGNEFNMYVSLAPEME